MTDAQTEIAEQMEADAAIPGEPTVEECEAHAPVWAGGGRYGVALWYPQMGGHAGRAVAVFDRQWQDHGHTRWGGCIDVYVWHDGEFPFSGERDPGVQPVLLHHCDPEQFVEFGKTLKEMNERGRREVAMYRRSQND